MSTPAAPAGSGPPEDDRRGLSKFVRRASKVFRRRSSARKSMSAPSDLTQTASGAAPAEPSAPAVSSPPPIEEATAEEQPAAPPPALTTTQQTTEPKSVKPPSPRLVMTAAAYGTIQEERARALFAKYGLTLEPGEWTLPIKPDAQRVEKKIRMRVHRTCHRCQTSFGPEKRAKEPKEKGIATTGGAAAAIGHTTLNLKSLTISSRTTGRQITYKPMTQRVRRTCHMCNALFAGKTNECANCGHTSCRQCPREPPKTEKYPAGYPGDSDYNIVTRERHPIRVHRDKPKLNPDAVKSVEERMRAMDLSPQASAA
ncbi:MAG: hypothetical protein Q9211_002260 [Gyalolechia sp. 1 TL-2023]